MELPTIERVVRDNLRITSLEKEMVELIARLEAKKNAIAGTGDHVAEYRFCLKSLRLKTKLYHLLVSQILRCELDVFISGYE